MLNVTCQNTESHTESFDPSFNHDSDFLRQTLLEELQDVIPNATGSVKKVIDRITREVERICHKSSRIQNSGQIRTWQLSLGRHRLQKCLSYYRLGSKQGRVELHSHLSAIIYRYINPGQGQASFQARYNLIEDFLQDFYGEAMKAMRRENELPENYTPRTQLELAEYMAFTEQYAKRRINLPNGTSQQLVVLRAQSFSRRLPTEATVDIEKALEFSKGEEGDVPGRAAAAQQLRSQLVSDSLDPSEAVLRDRVVTELIQYLESQSQSDCVDYLILKLKDCSAPEIDEILQLTPRQRDYLQQRFKYHVEKFARTHHWQLVHEWLGADLDQKLGLSSQQWDIFWQQLTPDQQQLFTLKQSQASDLEIQKVLKCTPKQLQKRWTSLLNLAYQVRNQEV